MKTPCEDTEHGMAWHLVDEDPEASMFTKLSTNAPAGNKERETTKELPKRRLLAVPGPESFGLPRSATWLGLMLWTAGVPESCMRGVGARPGSTIIILLIVRIK